MSVVGHRLLRICGSYGEPIAAPPHLRSAAAEYKSKVRSEGKREGKRSSSRAEGKSRDAEWKESVARGETGEIMLPKTEKARKIMYGFRMSVPRPPACCMGSPSIRWRALV